MEVIFLTESTEIAIYPTKPNKLISMHFEMINNMLMELLEEKSLKADPPNSSQEMMRVLPEQVIFKLIAKDGFGLNRRFSNTTEK